MLFQDLKIIKTLIKLLQKIVKKEKDKTGL